MYIYYCIDRVDIRTIQSNAFPICCIDCIDMKYKQYKLHFSLIFYLKVKVTPHTHPPCTFFNQVLHMWYMVCLPGFMPTPF